MAASIFSFSPAWSLSPYSVKLLRTLCTLALGLVLGLYQLEFAFVVCCVELGVLHHLLNLGFGEARVGLDGDLVSLPVPLSLAPTCKMPLASMSNDTSICGVPSAARRNALEVELAQHLVGAGNLAFTLEHLDGHRRLVIVRSGEGLVRTWWEWWCSW